MQHTSFKYGRHEAYHFFETSWLDVSVVSFFWNFLESTKEQSGQQGPEKAASKVQVKGRKTFCIKLWWILGRTTVWATCEVVHFRLGKILNLRDMAPIELSTFEMRLLNVERLERQTLQQSSTSKLAGNDMGSARVVPKAPRTSWQRSLGFWRLLDFIEKCYSSIFHSLYLILFTYCIRIYLTLSNPI